MVELSPLPTFFFKLDIVVYKLHNVASENIGQRERESLVRGTHRLKGTFRELRDLGLSVFG